MRDQMRYLIFVVICFVVFCSWLVIESGLFENRPQAERRCILLQQSEPVVKPQVEYLAPRFTPGPADLTAAGGPVKSVTLGSVDPKSGYKFQLALTSEGAAIDTATLSQFDDRNYKNPQPLVLLSPVSYGNGQQILSLAIKKFVLIQQKQQFALDKLSWNSFDIEKTDGNQSACFEAVITDSASQPIIKLTKTYSVVPDSYLLECKVTIENLSDIEQEVRFNLTGPTGIGREDISRDTRKVVAAFKDPQGQIYSARLDRRRLTKPKNPDDIRLKARKADDKFLWAAATNKYFAAVIVPVPDANEDFCTHVTDKMGAFYNPDRDRKADSGDETIGLDLAIAPATLKPLGQTGSSRIYSFQLYFGPKDKGLFDKNQLYRKLRFTETIDFVPCFCCPASIINPLAFGILTTMKWMYGFIGNYGVVIIILVFLIRIVLHPITKKSQVSMSKMSKLAPKAEEIKKKYANNKAEMNKQMMALYKEHGASPIMGMLPMMAQMPIWIALWSAVNASIDLRGAAFLPFWITDLSAPDALIRFSAITVPLLGWKIESLNLLPILMGVAFYLQQKLTPSQPAASSSPQMAQQQKMMMIMLPVLFPLMFYKLASGVNLYIMTSTFAQVIEQHVIRKHIRQKEQEESKGLVAATSKTGGKVKKKKPKPFFKW